MKINFLISILSVFLFFICTSTECKKEMETPKYNFLEKVDLFPYQKQYHVGDTLIFMHWKALILIYQPTLSNGFLKV